jgi:hypothetical protein
MALSGFGPTRTRPSVNIAAGGSHREKSLARPEQPFWMVPDPSALRPRRSFSSPETSTLTSSASTGWFPEKPLTSSDSKYP